MKISPYKVLGYSFSIFLQSPKLNNNVNYLYDNYGIIYYVNTKCAGFKNLCAQIIVVFVEKTSKYLKFKTKKR